MVEALFDISEPGENKAKAACKGRAAGIDLGTTNSLVAIVEAGSPRCLPDEANPRDFLVPSTVYFGEDGSVEVGRRARDEKASLFPHDTIISAKRFMGRGPNDAAVSEALTPYRFAHDEDSDRVVRFSVAGGKRAVTPIEVSAEVLAALKVRAEKALEGPLDGVVITVPAYFDDAQRQATRDAGRLAGLEVLRLLNEPTAAALAYGLEKKAEGLFAVFDLGGGTFDISVLALEDGVFEVKATGGDSELGGDDFDRALAQTILARVRASAGEASAPATDAKTIRRAIELAKRAKEALTDAASVSVDFPRADSGTPVAVVITRSDLEQACQPILDRCAGPVKLALKDAGISSETRLDGVVLVGGSTRMPLVRDFVTSVFGQEPLGDIDPDQVVAIGAAISADQLAGEGAHDVVLLDVVPLSLGLEMMGGVVEKLIHRNTTVPCGATQTFTTYADNQTGFDLHVLQGERELVDGCRSLARFKLTESPQCLPVWRGSRSHSRWTPMVFCRLKPAS